MSSIYLDYQATTPVDPRVLEAMLPFFTEHYGNAQANTYVRGLNASRAVEVSRRKVAIAVKAKPSNIIFTSGATEANNLAILGTASSTSKRHRIVTQSTEHHSVLGPTMSLRDKGYEIAIARVGADGIVDLRHLEKLIDRRTLLVSVMHVNNETGVIQPIAEIAEICRTAGALFHCDCAQVLGKLPINVVTLGVDMATFSAHKAYGPKGIGALYVKDRRRSNLRPVWFGGGHEGGLRPGTLPVPLCVGFGAAAEIAHHEQPAFAQRANDLAGQVWRGILEVEPRARLNGHANQRASGCLSIFFPGAQADALIDGFHGLDISKGSACEASKTRASHVLRAMGFSATRADATIRMSIGRFTTQQDVDKALEIIRKFYDTTDTKRPKS